MDGDEIIEDIHLPSKSGTQTNYNNKNKKPWLIRDDEDYSEDDLATKDKEINLEKINKNETINSKKTKLNYGDFIIVKYEVTKRNILYIGQISKVNTPLLQVNFLRKKKCFDGSSTIIFPQVPDKSNITMSQVVRKIVPIKSLKRGRFTFLIDSYNFN